MIISSIDRSFVQGRFGAQSLVVERSIVRGVHPRRRSVVLLVLASRLICDLIERINVGVLCVGVVSRETGWFGVGYGKVVVTFVRLLREHRELLSRCARRIFLFSSSQFG